MRLKGALVMFGTTVAHRIVNSRNFRRRSVTAIALIGILLTVSSAYLASKPRGVFWSRVTVKLEVPTSSVYPNSITASSHSLVVAAGEIARFVDPSGGKKLLADQGVTLASEGLTHATQVTLPNSGSQFVTSFDEQLLQVEAVGTTVHEVQSRMQVALGEIRRVLGQLEHRDNLAPQNRIPLQYSPARIPQIFVQGGSRIRAVLSIALLGAGLTALALHLARTVGVRRRPDGEDADTDDAEVATERALVELGR